VLTPIAKVQKLKSPDCERDPVNAPVIKLKPPAKYIEAKAPVIRIMEIIADIGTFHRRALLPFISEATAGAH
jgi:hypothetical protein